MKKFVIFLLVLGALVGGGAYAVSRLVSVEKLTVKAQEIVKERTGRDLSFEKAKVYFWPNVGLRLTGVKLGNPRGFGIGDMLELGSAELQLALEPLFRKQVEVKKFVLKEPVLRLERRADAKANWEFPSQKADTALKTAADGSVSVPQDVSFKFGTFEISDGKLFYSDRITGKDYAIDDIDINVIFPSLDSAFQMDGAAIFRGQRVNMVVYLEKPVDSLRGKDSRGSVQMSMEPAKAKLEGNFSTRGTLFKGHAEADISSLSGLLAFVSGGEAGKLPFSKVSFAGDLNLGERRLALQDATLALDEIRAGGSGHVEFGRARPELQARLSLDRLALDRFMAGPSAPVAGQNEKKVAGKDVQEAGWDATPIDFSGLRALDADLILKTDGFSLKGIEAGASTLKAVLKDGSLRFSSSDATLLGGRFSSEGTINAQSQTPALSLRFGMQEVESKPVLEAFAGFSKLSGKVDADISVMSAGVNQQSIVGSLTGDGRVVFRNGALEGIDLVNIAKMIQQKLTNMGVGEGKTDFVELGGSFTVSKGVAVNKDLKMRGPLVQASGAGQVDLPKKFLDYRVTPVLTASSAVEGASGIGVPVDIRGPFSAIKVKPDYASVIRNIVENPEDAKAVLKGAKEQGKMIEDNLKQLKKDLKSDPNAALQNLLGGGLLGIPAVPAAPPSEGVPAQ